MRVWPLRAPFARLARASIWAPKAIPVTEGQTARELKRVVLPLLDIVFIGMGITAINLGMPTFEIVQNEQISMLAAWTLTVGGMLALLGVAFPRLWTFEALGKLAVVTVLGGYAGGLWVLAIQGDGARALTAGAYTGLLVLPFWTLARLGRERRGRTPAPHTGGDR